MSRKNRRELRMLEEQDTVGMERAERKLLAEMTGKKKTGLDKLGGEVLEAQEEKVASIPIRPRRAARPGKPAKR